MILGRITNEDEVRDVTFFSRIKIHGFDNTSGDVTIRLHKNGNIVTATFIKTSFFLYSSGLTFTGQTAIPFYQYSYVPSSLENLIPDNFRPSSERICHMLCMTGRRPTLVFDLTIGSDGSVQIGFNGTAGFYEGTMFVYTL